MITGLETRVGQLVGCAPDGVVPSQSSWASLRYREMDEGLQLGAVLEYIDMVCPPAVNT